MTNKKINVKDHNLSYKNLLEFYDYANELIAYIEEESGNPVVYLELVESIVEMIEESVDIVAAEHRDFMENGQTDIETATKIGNALRGIYVEINISRKKISTRMKLQNLLKFRRLSKTLDKIEKHVEKTHKEMSHVLDLKIKDYHYSRSGRQEGQVLSKNTTNTSNGNGE
jgi:hypothetical protein